ncbi:MAG: lipid IV(A) 3-deoxy-D-manno-octulosonic acid transferase [Panacagrimonas sp.]
MRLLYTLLIYLLTPVLVARLLWRSRQIRGYRERIGERFGFVPRAAEGVAVWVHGVSVGESLAALPLIRRLIERHGAGRIWVTTTTPTGSERIRSALGDQVIHTYLPYDLPGSVSRFLDRARPRQVVIMETELWPHLFRQLRRRSIPITIANARLSPRSLRGYSRVAGFTRSVLADTTLVAAQSGLDAQRFAQLGAPRAENIGNLKFDIEPPSAQVEAGKALRRWLGDPRRVWIAASTHETEETAALEAHRELRKAFPDAVLLLVPRDPRRFDEVAALAGRGGFQFHRRSQWTSASSPFPDTASVLLGDSLGEMWMYLAASDVAFVGGSFVPVGGHNVLEPATLGLPVLFGPHMHNFLDPRALLLEAGAAQELGEPGELTGAIADALGDPSRRRAMGLAGQRAVLANRGALDRLLQLLPSN